MYVDPPRGNETPVGIDFPAARAGFSARLDDPAIADRHVARECFAACAINNATSTNHKIVHALSPGFTQAGCQRPE
jgi:hypothetical protein